MMKDFGIELDDAPDPLASTGGTMSDVGVNFEGLDWITCNGRSVIQFVVDDAETARRVLEEPGTDAKIDLRYPPENNMFIFGVDKIARARQSLG